MSINNRTTLALKRCAGGKGIPKKSIIQQASNSTIRAHPPAEEFCIADPSLNSCGKAFIRNHFRFRLLYNHYIRVYNIEYSSASATARQSRRHKWQNGRHIDSTLLICICLPIDFRLSSVTITTEQSRGYWCFLLILWWLWPWYRIFSPVNRQHVWRKTPFKWKWLYYRKNSGVAVG